MTLNLSGTVPVLVYSAGDVPAFQLVVWLGFGGTVRGRGEGITYHHLHRMNLLLKQCGELYCSENNGDLYWFYPMGICWT